MTWSFISRPHAELFGGGAPALALANPIAADLSDMRPSLVPGLAAAAERNSRRGLKDVALFEVGQIFLGDGENDQRIAAASLRRGLAKRRGAGRHWSGGGGVDMFDAKGDALDLLDALGVAAGRGPDRARRPGVPASRPLGDAAVRPEEHRRLVRRAAPERAARRSTSRGRSSLSRSCSTPCPRRRRAPTKARPKLERSEFMPVERDLAFIVSEQTKAGDILKAALSADRALIAGVDVFDVYRGAGRAGGLEVGRDRRDPAAARAHADRGRDRRGGGEDRGRGRQEDRRDAARLRRAGRLAALAALALAGPAKADPCAKYEDPLAYNACLAKQGPQAHGAKPTRDAGGPRATPAKRGPHGRERMEFTITPR